MRQFLKYLLLTFLFLSLSACGVKSGANFSELTSSQVVALTEGSDTTTYLYVSRETCPHCQVFRPHLEAVMAELPNQTVIVDYDTDVHVEDLDYSKVLSTYKLERVPSLFRIEPDGTFTLYQGGNEDEVALAEFFKD